MVAKQIQIMPIKGTVTKTLLSHHQTLGKFLNLSLWVLIFRYLTQDILFSRPSVSSDEKCYKSSIVAFNLLNQSIILFERFLTKCSFTAINN